MTGPAPVLREYQMRAVAAVRAHVMAGTRSVLLVLATGGGKTVIFSDIIRSFRERSRKAALVIAHRDALVDQAVEKLAAVGVRAGAVMGSDKRADPSLDTQVATIQTLHRRIDRLPPAGLIIYDEAHHAAARSSREVLAKYPDAILIGCTATPWRRDGGLGEIFKTVVVGGTPRELIGQLALVPCDPFAYDAPDLHEVPVVAGDYKPSALEAACNTSVLVGSVVREYITHAPGRRAIVFPVRCDHSKSLVAEFQAAGVIAAHIDWSTPSEERRSMIEAFRSGSLLVLSSVGVLTEGFDAPGAEVCILARPTKSLALFIQMAGRVLRPAPGKARAIIHDHGGNLFRFGFPEDDREYTLSEAQRFERDLMVCTACGFATARFRSDGTCPKCGSLQIMPEEEREASDRRRGKEQVEGRRLSRDQIQEILDAAKARGRELTRAQAVKVARATRAEKAAEYLRLCAIQQQRGFLRGFVGNQYRQTFGHWPRFTDAELAGVAPAERPFLPLPPRHPDPLRRDPAAIRAAVLG